MFFRYRWPAEKPGIFHDVVKFEDGKPHNAAASRHAERGGYRSDSVR
jgi:hypothetical protein